MASRRPARSVGSAAVARLNAARISDRRRSMSVRADRSPLARSAGRA